MPSQSEVVVFVAGLLAFWLIVNLLNKTVTLSKYGFKVSLVVIKYESPRFKAFIHTASLRSPVVWKVFSNLSVALGAGLLILAIYLLSENLLKLILPGGGGSPVLPVLPGLTIRVYWLPYFILAFLVAALTHETAHGIVSQLEGVNIKSAGLFFALAQPGGFVEPEEKALADSPTASKMRILSAGSSANLLVGLLVLLVISLLFFRAPSGIVVIELLDDGPLERAGLQRWDVIYSINGTQIATIHDLDDYMTNVNPGDWLILNTSRGGIFISTISNPQESEKAAIGLISSMVYYPCRVKSDMFLQIQLYTTLSWTFLLLVNLAILSMLPFPLFDGDRFVHYFLQKYASKAPWWRAFFNAVSLFLIAANIALTIGSGLLSF